MESIAGAGSDSRSSRDEAVTEEEDIDLENEEEEAEEAEEEEDNDEGGGGYEFRFSEDMDPLSFTQHDSSGLQPYQQFERLEHQANHTIDRELSAKRPRLDETVSGATMQEIMEVMNLGSRRRRRSTKAKKRGRRKGSTNKNKDSPEVTRKLGDATLRFSMGQHEEAIGLFNEVIRLSPNLPDPYHRLGVIYHQMGDKKRAFDFYMIAAHLTPKETSLWKLLVTWSLEEGDKGKAKYCLSKALTADPKDIKLQSQRACLFVELGDYLKAADSYEQISRLYPAETDTIKTAARLYKKCGQQERAVTILENFLGNFPNEVDLTVVDLLTSLLMEANAHVKALELIEKFSGSEKETPLHLVTRAGICHVSLGNMEKANAYFQLLQRENIHDQRHLIFEVGDSLMNHGHHESALEYYMMLTGDTGRNNGYLNLKIVECYSNLQKRLKAIEYFYKSLEEFENSVDARLTLSPLLVQEGKDDEAISVLLSPKESDPKFFLTSNSEKPWWLDGKIKLKLSQIYRSRGLTEAFVDVIWSVVHDTLFIETIQQKFRPRKRLAKSVLSDRLKVLGENQTDTVFQGFRPVALAADLSRASRAKKILKKKETAREAKRAAALAAGIEWTSDNSEDESPQQAPQELPLPNLLKDEDHHSLLIDLCKGLKSLKRYWEALEIINLTLILASDFLSVERKEEFRTLGVQIAYNISDPAHGWEYAKYIVNQHPNSFAAWNCYYKVISKLDSRLSKHSKFLHSMRTKHRSCVPAILIFGHQFTMISQHQIAAREYMEAYKLMPDAPLVNLCVGTSLINLALGHRLQNKHQCVAQGLSFLQNNLRLCKNSQESLYNIARAFHHVGLVTLAVANYEKVLAMYESDCPIPTLPNEKPDVMSNGKPEFCDLRREAAYNLHLIYKKSGAIDLARQVLKDYCVT